MDNVSRPLIALLVGTVAFLALWLVAFKPSGSSSGASSSQGLGAYQTAIAKAHQAVTTANVASAAQGGEVATTSAPAASAPAATASAAKPTTTHVSSAASRRLDVVTRALRGNRVLALLFFNPAGADDRAVKQELATVPTHGGRVVKLAVPVGELTRYAVVTNQVQVSVSPTLVLIDPHQQASTIVGFADRFEIAQRVSDALRIR